MDTILHIADTHLGYAQYHSPVREADFDAAFEAVIDAAVENEVDAVVHSGDLYHHSRPDVDTLAGTLERLQRLDAADIPYLGIVGNHEGTSGEQWVDIFDQLELGRRLGRSPVIVGETAFYGLDFVSPARRKRLPYDFEAHDAEYAALAAHGLFSPVADGGRWPLREVMSASSVAFDGILLGDDHVPHVTEVRDTAVAYPGSTDRTQSDQRAPRGYHFVGIGGEPETTTDGSGPGRLACVDIDDEGNIDTDPDADADTDGDGTEMASGAWWSDDELAARESGVVDATSGVTGSGPVYIERREMRTRPFRYIDLDLNEGEGIGRVREAFDARDIEDAVVIVRLNGDGEPVLQATVEEYARESGALGTRVTDTRTFGPASGEETVSFADPDAAVEDRVREMDLSAAGHDIERMVRKGSVSDTSMADEVQSDIGDRIDEQPDDFLINEGDGGAGTANANADAGASESESDSGADEDGGESGRAAVAVADGSEGGESASASEADETVERDGSTESDGEADDADGQATFGSF